MQTECNKYILKSIKRKTLTERVDDCRHDTNGLYALVANLTGTKSENPLPSNQSDEDMANMFADYFMEKIEKIRSSWDNHPKYEPSNDNITPLLSLTLATEDEVISTINALKTKTCEKDPISTDLFKEIVPLITEIVTKLINKCLTEGAFSIHWKKAIIHPLLEKPGIELIASNYRPVSNLSFLSKVVEKIVLTRFNKHCDKFQLMPGYQLVYRKNFSCETAIIKITNDILWSMESKKITSLTCIDLSAAFDTVDHGILLNVLQNKFGISGNALSWFKSYLQPRFCKVNIHNANSEDKELHFSVPQGSCAGPVLYSVYASTLQEVVPLDLHGYADDHGLKTNFMPVPEYEAKEIADTEQCLTDIKTWMDHNQLHMNNAKTEFILFAQDTNYGSVQPIVSVQMGKKFPAAIALSTLAHGWTKNCLSDSI